MAVLFLASDDAAWISGQTMIVDGGELGGGDWYDPRGGAAVPDEGSAMGVRCPIAVDSTRPSWSSRRSTSTTSSRADHAVGAGRLHWSGSAALAVGRVSRRSRSAVSTWSAPAMPCGSLTSSTRSLPDVKADDPERTFPGALGGVGADRHAAGRIGSAGLGVLSVCDWLAAGYTARGGVPGLVRGHGGTGCGR